MPRGRSALIIDGHQQRREVLSHLCQCVQLKPVVLEALEPVALKSRLDEQSPDYCFFHGENASTREELQSQIAQLRELIPEPCIVILVSASVWTAGDLPAGVDHLLSGFLVPSQFLRALVGSVRQSETTAVVKENMVEAAGSAAFRQRNDIRLLLVDDNKVNRVLVVHHLRRYGIVPAEAVDGQDALNAMKAHDYDLILMDCAMPVMDGYQATTAIRQWEAEHQQPHRNIVAVTAHALEGERERCLDAGMDYYITKPIRSADILQLLQKYCQLEP